MFKLSVQSLLFFVFVSFSLSSQAGFLTNGGDAVVGDFMNVYNQIIDKMSNHPDLDVHDLSNDFKRLESSVCLSSNDHVYLDGIEKGAINISDGHDDMRIVISLTLWPKYQFRSKALLVIHELLPLAGRYDQTYRKSNEILNLLYPAVNDYQIPVLCQDIPTYLRRNGDVVISAYELCLKGNFVIGSDIFRDCITEFAREHIFNYGRNEGRCL